MQTQPTPPNLAPIDKVKFGGFFSLLSVAIIAFAKAADISLDPVLASAITTVVYFGVSWAIPLKYQGQLGYLNQVAEMLIAMHPGLSQSLVVDKLKSPTATARLISSADAIADLERERIIK